MRVDSQRLDRCLDPRHIALVGGKEVEKVLEQCRKMDYQGAIWVINPNRESLGGIPCFADISQCPVVPDATFIAIPAHATIPLIEYLRQNGEGGVVCYSSGFGELGEKGKQLQQQLIAAASDMPLLGPNCHGYINALSGAALWPDQHGMRRLEKGVAIISSSGNVSINLSVQQRALPIALLITVGNQAVMGVEEIISSVIRNSKTNVIGLHIEGLTNITLFVELMFQARQANIPVVVLKTGKSVIGARITMSHTATMAGESALYDALFSQLGVAQVATVEEFVETLKFLSINGVMRDNKIASMSCSGGEASLIADLSAFGQLQFPRLEEQHKQLVQQTLNEYVEVENPLDYHTFIWGNYSKLLKTFSAMLKGQFDLTILILDFPLAEGCDHSEYLVALDAFIDAVQQSSCQAAVIVSLPENINPQIMDKLAENGITPLLGFSQALLAIESAYMIGSEYGNKRKNIKIFKNQYVNINIETNTLSENEAKNRLAEAHCPVPRSWLITQISNVVSSQMAQSFPLVAKAVGETIQHKTEIGGVILGINNQDMLVKSIEQLKNISDTVLVEQMIEGVIAELLVCVSYDSQFGYYLVLGSGGTLVEILRDKQIVLLPADHETLEVALNKLKIAPLLNGYRGKEAVNLSALIDTISKIVGFVLQQPDLLEVEINPLLVTADEAVIVDALITQIAVD